MKTYLVTGLLLIGLAACSDHVDVQFQSCEQAEQAGVQLPLMVGDVGWNAKLDTDHDGLACE